MTSTPTGSRIASASWPAPPTTPRRRVAGNPARPVRGLLRDGRDAWLLLLAAVHGVVVACAPPAAVVALLFWWNANALSHQHVHRRFFRRRGFDAAFSAWLSLVLGVPQRLWRARHLAHHAGRACTLPREGGFVGEVALVVGLHAALAILAPAFYAWSYLPGLGAGLLLCALHGHFEHRGGTTSHYGRTWNALLLNDGYHVEHHAYPSLPTRALPNHRDPNARASRWPPVLRWLDALLPATLDALERVALRCAPLRRAVYAAHRRALLALFAGAPAPRRVLVVGGGLFPRSALLAHELWPTAAITVLDAEARHLDRARPWLPSHVATLCAHYDPGAMLDADVVFLPLALRGARARAYATPPAPLCLVHDWAWRRRGRGCIVAWWLAKRVNLVAQRSTALTPRGAPASNRVGPSPRLALMPEASPTAMLSHVHCHPSKSLP